MEKVHQSVREQAKAGHNSAARTEQIQALVARYAETHKLSQELNDERGELREKVAEMGLDTKAFQDQVKRSLQDLKKREGYDESAKEVAEAIGKMKPAELWAHVFEREEKKNAERQEKAKAKEAEKAKAEEFKSAPTRKPKEPKKSTGQQQAEAYEKAHAVN